MTSIRDLFGPPRDVLVLEQALEIPSSGDGTERSLAALEDKAAQHNCELVVAGPFELLLDIDNEHDEKQFDVSMKLLFERHPFLIKEVQGWKSRNGHKHVRVVLNHEVGWHDRIMYQAMFGSDRSREVLTFNRSFEAANPDPVVLFRPHGAAMTTWSSPTYNAGQKQSP